MNRLKTALLLVCTLCFVLLGASMPELAAKMQDVRIGKRREEAEFRSVNLTLWQEGDVGPVLHLLAQEHMEGFWEGQTAMTEADACRAALAVMEALHAHGLLPTGEWEALSQADGSAEPYLLVGEDGSSVLIWGCIWNCDAGLFITVDDTTGKAVRILVENALADVETTEEDIFLQLKRWDLFFQDYYNVEFVELTGINDDSSLTEDGLPLLSDVRFFRKDGSGIFNLRLEISKNWVFFNYS